MMLTFTSCNDSENMTAPEDQTVSSARSSAGCNPDDLPELFPDCTSSSENKTINFFVNTVYNNNSPIFDYCPGVSLDVTYTLWDCPGTNPITAISNLTYDLADLTNACPALAQAIQDAENAGTIQIVDLLDQLDFDISSQLEYQIVYEAMETQKVDCEEMEAIGIKVISDVCYTWHYRTGLGGGKGGGRYTKVLCDNSVCCIRSTAYCGNYDANGDLVTVTHSLPTTYNQTQGDCGASNQGVSCFHACENRIF